MTVNSQNITKSDTVAWVNDKMLNDKAADKIIKNTAPFKPDPNKAVLYSAIFPGLGQIYNKKYWKLPLVYGGFLGLTYAITWNGRQYSDYTGAYKAIMKENPRDAENTRIWGPFIPRGKNPELLTDGEIATWRNRFKRQRDSYRRYRDLSIIGAVALYGLCMIDAYVDAHLFDFDISPDLSMRVEPQVQNDPFSQRSFGIQCSFKF
ncbi:DUF5683 domain-containing protein [Dysgonomonas alginatilytica]|nr:DUF5683 domain-containing protein [Dysgonomonas alginatilytica]